MKNLTSTKFVQSSFCQLVSAIALFTGNLTGGEWVAVSTLVLAVYGAANVAAAHVERNAP